MKNWAYQRSVQEGAGGSCTPHAGKSGSDRRIHRWGLVLSVAVFEAPAGVAGLEDVAVVGQAVENGGGHLGITKHLGPIGEAQVGGDQYRRVRELTPFYGSVKPPSTLMAAPVTNEASSEHNQVTTSPISRGSPMRPMG